MKVVFIYSQFDSQSVTKPLEAWSEMSFGISYISSLLKSHNYETRLLVMGSKYQRFAPRILDSFFREFDPQLICFTAVASQYSFINHLAGIVKKQWPDKYLLVGGVHATLKTEEVIHGPFDGVCVGEGEYPTLELCRQLETFQPPANIQNLWLKSKDGSIQKNSPRQFLQDIDSLPFPDYDMWSPWIQERTNSLVSLLLGRGCPYPCTYCCNHALKKIASGQYVRKRSPENIIDEIAYLHKRFPEKKFFHLEVESIALDKDWLFRFCGQLEKFNSSINHKIEYSCNYRISDKPTDEALFIAMQNAGISKINIGLESGSEKVRQKILKRNYSNYEFLNTATIAKRHNIKINIFNMIGLPGETLQDHMETVALNRQCQPDNHFTGIFHPYPGTILHKTCTDNGWLQEKPNFQKERNQSFLNLPDFPRRSIQHAYNWFDFRIYYGYKPLWLILLRRIRLSIHKRLWIRNIIRVISRWPLFNKVRARLYQ